MHGLRLSAILFICMVTFCIGSAIPAKAADPKGAKFEIKNPKGISGEPETKFAPSEEKIRECGKKCEWTNKMTVEWTPKEVVADVQCYHPELKEAVTKQGMQSGKEFICEAPGKVPKGRTELKVWPKGASDLPEKVSIWGTIK